MSNKILVIVESPAKCKKIQKFLGNNYLVMASYGHIRNLNTKLGMKAIDVSNNFKPKFSIIKNKLKRINELKKCAKNCKEVIIASDLDREGEAIGYHLAHILKLKLDSTKRIVFNEITKKAITQAIQNPRTLDLKLIDAQQARQILDYMIGFEISPILWKYVRSKLSAGRCQSVSLSLIYDKEKEIESFKNRTYFNLNGKFKKKSLVIKGASKKEFKTKDEARKTLLELELSIFKVQSMKYSNSKIQPPPPYITSSIQQDCSSKLRISPKKTMMILQKLYEAGKITYMRTDSKIISKDCMNSIKNYITNNMGSQFYKKRSFTNSSKNTQEAHECIRPVKMTESELNNSFSKIESSVYDLIWKRTLATQLIPMEQQNLKLIIENNKNNILFESRFIKVTRLGFMTIYNKEAIDEIGNIQEQIEEGDILKMNLLSSEEKITNPPNRFTEASLIKELEKRGIGRPSTFSSIVDTLFQRRYIEKKNSSGNEVEILTLSIQNNQDIKEKSSKIKTNSFKQKIVITSIGRLVVDFLKEHFQTLMDYTYTNNMECNLDKIASGKKSKLDILNNAYKDFHPIVESLKQSQNVIKSAFMERKVFMKDPTTQKDIFVYNGKYGPVIQLGDNSDRDKKYFPLPKDIDISSVSKKIIREYIQYPLNIGMYKNKDVIIYYGKNGFYIKYGKNSLSIDSPNITIDEFKQLYKNQEEKMKEKSKSIIKSFKNGGISIRTGKYGAYILKLCKKKKNIIKSIPNSYDVEKLSLKDCEIILKL